MPNEVTPLQKVMEYNKAMKRSSSGHNSPKSMSIHSPVLKSPPPSKLGEREKQTEGA